MIYLQLTDGLGNQMFQYAFARSLQLHTGDELRVNTYAFTKDAQRSYSLEPYCLSAEATYRLLPEMKGKKQYCVTDFWNHLIYRLHLCRGKENFERLAKLGIYFSFEIYSYLGVPASGRKNKLVAGNFQSYKYFESCRDTICKDFTLRPEVLSALKQETIALREQMLSEEAVCVHVRRGDYVTNEKDLRVLNICGEEYYKQALRIVSEKVEKPRFYVFSNDHEDIMWVKEHYSFFPEDTVFVDLNNCDYEELHLMTGCKHYIIANSTYSWWAQYLGRRNADSLVIAPGAWTRQDYETDDIYMPDWCIVPVE